MIKIPILFIIMIASLHCAFGQSPLNDGHWQLVWEDNFDTALNLNNWHVLDNHDHWGYPTLFLEENVYTENGYLVCEIKREDNLCQFPYISEYWCNRQWEAERKCSQGLGHQYCNFEYMFSGGWVESKQVHNTQYGYIEAKIDFPYGEGFWPAFWTYQGEGVVNPVNAAEIDIAEMLGELGPYTYTTNRHLSGVYDPSVTSTTAKISPAGYNWFSGTSHIYAIEWSPAKIIYYLDDSPIRVLPNHGVVDPVKCILGIGVRADGNKLPLWTGINNSTFPQKMKTDYVKVYDLNIDCNNDLNLCSYNFSNHPSQVKRNIYIGNGSCSNQMVSNDNVIMRASEGIIVNSNFTVPVGAELYLDVTGCY